MDKTLLGSVVICKDLLGVVTDIPDDKYVCVKIADGTVYTVFQKGVTVLTNPHALAFLLYNNVCKKSRS
jgi:hypothetical protein